MFTSASGSLGALKFGKSEGHDGEVDVWAAGKLLKDIVWVTVGFPPGLWRIR